jgi:tRNA (adenine57-N1/adenine58-N1)-methyltransferase
LHRAKVGDRVLLIGQDHKRFIRKLVPGEKLETHRGILLHDDLIDQPLGAVVRTHMGHAFYLLSPTTDDLVRGLPRQSQIIFPKDAGYIALKLGIHPGVRVVEAGTGSGGLCLTLATLVGDVGHVFSYDVRESMQQLAARNLRRAGMEGRVTFKLRDIAEGFDEDDADALFLDVLTPWAYLDQAHAALRGSGMLGALVPTVNQLIQLVDALDGHPGFVEIEAEELILRPYKTLPIRVRPEDRIIGHTGYLIFARTIIPDEETSEEA